MYSIKDGSSVLSSLVTRSGLCVISFTFHDAIEIFMMMYWIAFNRIYDNVNASKQITKRSTVKHENKICNINNTKLYIMVSTLKFHFGIFKYFKVFGVLFCSGYDSFYNPNCLIRPDKQRLSFTRFIFFCLGLS